MTVRPIHTDAQAGTPPIGRWLQVISQIVPPDGNPFSNAPQHGFPMIEAMARNSRFDVGLATFRNHSDGDQPNPYRGNHLTVWPASRSAWLSTTSIRRSFGEEVGRYDGVHIHGLWEQGALAGSRAARSLGKPYLVSAHGMLQPGASGGNRLKRYVYGRLVVRPTIARASALHAHTRAEAAHYLSFGARSPIAIIPDPVEVPRSKDPSQFLAAFPELRNRRLVLFIGRLGPQSGLQTLLRAWRGLPDEYPDAKLVLAGPDEEGTRETLETIVSSQGLNGSVTFTGMLDETTKWSALAAAECFILPSPGEALNRRALEAMGVGLPVIVTQPCNLPEVQRFETGWEVRPDAESLTLALEEFLENSSLDNLQIGCRGADLIASRYSSATVTRQLGDVYEWLGGGPTPRNLEIIFP